MHFSGSLNALSYLICNISTSEALGLTNLALTGWGCYKNHIAMLYAYSHTQPTTHTHTQNNLAKHN